MYIAFLFLFRQKIIYPLLEQLQSRAIIKHILLYLSQLCNSLVFNEYKDKFYLENVKKVPCDIYQLLTLKGLAFWIMDDGSRHGDGLHISVYAFSNEDVDKLMFTLHDKFNLLCSIHYNREMKPRIYIFKQSMDKLTSLISPYFIKEMLYKLGL